MTTKHVDINTKAVDDEIDRLLELMSETNPETPEYAKIADQVTKLFKMKEIDVKLNIQQIELVNKQNETDIKLTQANADCALKEVDTELKKKQIESIRFGLSTETWALIGANLAGIVLILGFEKANVVTSKALGFISRLR